MSISKEPVNILDATPNKRIFLSIIADYGLNTGICELVDNSFDSWNVPSKGQQLQINILADPVQQKITVTDNAGGVAERNMDQLISPGASSTTGTEKTIGTFGVGSKRAAVALSQLIRVTSRHRKLGTFQIEYDDEWLRNDDWHLNLYKVDDIAPSTTKVELSNLRIHLDNSSLSSLLETLSVVYARLIRKHNLCINLNGTPISPREFDDWAYPEEAPPKSFYKRVVDPDSGHSVLFRITAGLTLSKGSIGGDYGVFFYCNDRLIARAQKTPEVGFVTHLAGVPHPRMSLARIIVDLEGPAGDLPWNSSKSGINYNHWIFAAIRRDIVEVVTTYTRLSKNLQSEFDERVAPFKSGNVIKEKLERNAVITPSRLPKIPRAKGSIKDEIASLNASIVRKSPYTRGLYESLIAERLIFKQRSLEQKNRICLIILDSTVEIALKSYLVNDCPAPIGDARLQQVMENRHLVHSEVQKHVLTTDPIWKKLTYYYKLRCDLIHRKADGSISDPLVEDFRVTVQKLLSKLFKLRFPAR